MGIKGGCVERKGGYAFEGVWSYFFILFIILGYIYIIMKFEVIVVVIVGIIVRRMWCCCEGYQQVEFEYKGESGVKEVEIEFKKLICVCCVVIEVHVIPKWIDVYVNEYGIIKRVWFNDNDSDNGNVKVIRFDKMKPVVVTKGMRFVVSNNDMLVIKEIRVYTKKYQYAVVSYVSDDGNVKCLYMNHSRNEIDSDDCDLLCLNVLPYDMLFNVDINVFEIRNYDNTKVVSLTDDKSNCTVHNDSTIICFNSIYHSRLRVYNIHTVDISNLHQTDNDDILMFSNYTAEIKQLQLYLTKFRYIYKTFQIVVGYFINNINKYKRKSQAILNKINAEQINNTIKGTKLNPISNCNELNQHKNGWYYFNINDINIQLYCDFTSILNNPISIYIGKANDLQCTTLNTIPLETINNNIINLIINEILINKSTYFPMKEHFDILLITPYKGIIRTHKNEYILTDLNTLNPNRIKYILCTTTSTSTL